MGKTPTHLPQPDRIRGRVDVQDQSGEMQGVFESLRRGSLQDLIDLIILHMCVRKDQKFPQ
jgi:hypothetical protein